MSEFIESMIELPGRFQKREVEKAVITAKQKKENPSKYLDIDEIVQIQMDMALEGFFDEVDGTDICRDEKGWYILTESVWPDAVLALRERLEEPNPRFFPLSRRFIGELIGQYRGIRIGLRQAEKWHSSLPSENRGISKTEKLEEAVLLD